MIVFDTDILTLIQLKRGEEYDHIRRRLLEFRNETMATTIITFEEQMRGWLSHIASAKSSERLIRGYASLQRLLETFGDYEVLGYTASAAGEYERLRRSRIRIGSMDLKIAAITIANDAILISRNVRDFKQVPGLQVEDWTK